ncbi:MAG: SDR family oxidoreductase [Actinomycetia bacterium]|nr:SDR family oxidoreductase [Actinomycetes bacterium]MCP4957674.1 SDR family oxidoreductase [Actinomycetes bacterium]
MNKVAIVTGANSGIGRSTAVHLATQGWTVYGTMRGLDKGVKLRAMCEAAGVEVLPLVCDVTDGATVTAAVDKVIADTGRIDAIVNNAGIASNGTVEETSLERYEQVMDANLLGIIRFVQAVLPHMRERGEGCIVNVSSVIGRFASPGQAAYTASKWAVEGLSEELAHEVAAFGVRVVILEPGIVRTAMLAKNVDAPNESGAYDHTYGRMFSLYAAGLSDAGTPDQAAEIIFEAITTDEPKLRWTCGWGGAELAAAADSVDSDAFVALGAADDDAFYEGFENLFGLNIRA